MDEFAFHKTLPNAGETPFAQTFLRHSDPTDSREHWQHRYGCRAWLYVRRDPSTGAVLEVANLTGDPA